MCLTHSQSRSLAHCKNSTWQSFCFNLIAEGILSWATHLQNMILIILLVGWFQWLFSRLETSLNSTWMFIKYLFIKIIWERQTFTMGTPSRSEKTMALSPSTRCINCCSCSRTSFEPHQSRTRWILTNITKLNNPMETMRLFHNSKCTTRCDSTDKFDYIHFKPYDIYNVHLWDHILYTSNITVLMNTIY